MCTLCQQLGVDLHKLGAGVTDGATDGASASWAALPGGSGADAEGLGSDTVSGSTGTSSTMSGGTSVRGYINSSGDQDWYAVTLTAGQTYTFAESGFGVGALSDAYLRLLNSSGTQVAFDDDSGPLANSKLTFTASTSGTYYVSAQGYGTTTGQYLLTMATGTTPYAPTVSVSDIADYLTNSYWEVNGSVAHHWGVSTISYNVQGLTAARAALARVAFSQWSDVANLTFVETSGTAQIMLDDTQSGAYSSSNYGSNGIITSAIVNVEPTWYGSSSAIDSYTLQTFIHEIGHALGLGHAGPYNGSATYGVDNTYANDTWQYTVMSYMAESNFGGTSYRFTMTPMMADILAIQNLYGASNTHAGDTVYGFGSTAGSIYNFSTYSTAPALTIFDSGGTDTLNCSGYSNNQVINLTGGSFSNIGGLVGNIGIYTTAVIENAVGGSGSDSITGNSANNTLTGNGGNDTLTGGAGDDTLDGGTGTDTAVYSGGHTQYLVTLNSNGSYSVQDQRSGSPDGLDIVSNVELFQFTDGTYTLAQVLSSNHAPVVTVADKSATVGQTLSASSLFSVSDADSDTITKYQFWDATTGGGSFTVNGVTQGANQVIEVTAAQLAQTSFVVGAGGDDLYVRAYDGTTWSVATGAWDHFHLTATGAAAPTNHAPVVTVADKSATVGQTLSASSLFSVSDADSDTITKYQFYDATTGGGSFTVNGVTQGANQVIEVTAAQLAQTSFVVGSGGDDLYVRAYDGTTWSVATGAWDHFHLTATGAAPPTNHAPVVTVADKSATVGQTLSASSLFSVSDADSDTITKYQFYDATTGGGSFTVNGVTQGANQVIEVTAAQLAQTSFVVGAGGDDLYVRAYDGTTWSVATGAWDHFHLTATGAAPPTNHAPVVTVADKSATVGQTLSASSLFSVSDADSDTITKYQFYDATTGGGSFTVNGVTQGANQAIEVTAAQLAQTSFVVGSGGDDLYVRAYDGTTWSVATGAWDHFHLTATGAAPPTNHAPVVTVADKSATVGQTLSASSLFSVSDADSDTITKYQFYDATTGGGSFTVNGVTQGANQAIEVTAAQLAQTSFVVGSGGDDLYVRAYDGTTWSVATGAWDHFHLTATGAAPPTNHAPVVTVADKSATVGQTLSASSLFSVSDADSDTITKYQFYDATTGGGSFTVNGVTQGANQAIEVTAAQLAQTNFVVGAGGDDLYVRAYDGTTWSVNSGAWDHFHLTASAPTTNHAPVVTVADKSATVGQTLSASSLFSVADADSDTITKYQFYDATAGGGSFTVNGVTQGANQAIEVTAAQLAQTSFVVGAGGDDLYVRAYDGTTWSVNSGAWDHFHLTASAPPTNHAPVVTVADKSATVGQTLSASSLFSVSDADSDTITKYQFWDATTGGGHFTVNGVTQGANQAIEVTASQLAQTSFVVGSGGDDLYVRAYDGTTWSVMTGTWDHFHLTA